MGADLDVLRRWEAGGATWRVLARTPGELDVALLTCDAGEQVGRLVSTEPDLRRTSATAASQREDASDAQSVMTTFTQVRRPQAGQRIQDG